VEAEQTAAVEQEQVNDVEAFLNGTEQEVVEAQPEAKPETKAETKPAEQTSAENRWDSERQRADQAEANFRKLQREQSEKEAKLDAAIKQSEALQAKLDEIAKANDIDLDSMDTALVDASVLKVLKATKDRVDAANRRVSELEKVAKGYEEQKVKDQIATQQEQAKQEILADIEAEFPAKFRNEAIKMADKICADRGYSPSDRYEASKLLRSCYKRLSETKPSPKPATTDTGTKTATASPKEEVKPGSLREVMAQMRKKAGLST
jgi:vacuolar-type H+-ATPase subunit I/STV1